MLAQKLSRHPHEGGDPGITRLRASLKIAFSGNFVVTKSSREHVQVVRFPARKFGCLKISLKNLIFRGAL
jgi:hypothetical protein